MYCSAMYERNVYYLVISTSKPFLGESSACFFSLRSARPIHELSCDRMDGRTHTHIYILFKIVIGIEVRWIGTIRWTKEETCEDVRLERGGETGTPSAYVVVPGKTSVQ